MTKKIDLTKGRFAIVDDEDYEFLMNWCWYEDGANCASSRVGGKRTLMSRLIAKTPVGMVCDHINGNRYDNRKENLRNCTTSQNMMNQRPQKRPKTSKYKGVSFQKRSDIKKKWRAVIKINQKYKSMGSYATEEEAARAYNEAAKNLFGEYAHLNDIPPIDPLT